MQRRYSITDLGAIQGLSIRDGMLYIYGDVDEANPRVGAIREYTMDCVPTGRVVWLRKNGNPLILHPTGLTFHSTLGTFLGDTVNRKGTIYRLDWDAMWEYGTLDGAVLNVITDDAAINGCRPELVSLGGKKYLATTDYGDVSPEIRLMDIDAMLAAGRTAAPGVVVHRIPCGPYTQNLHWDAERGELTCVRNIIAGLQWRLDILNLKAAVEAESEEAPGVRVRRIDLDHEDELEGYRPMGNGRGIFVTSSPRDNVFLETLPKE
jgi:hypothetical protein